MTGGGGGVVACVIENQAVWQWGNAAVCNLFTWRSIMRLTVSQQFSQSSGRMRKEVRGVEKVVRKEETEEVRSGRKR